MGKKKLDKTVTSSEKIIYVTGSKGTPHSVRFHDPSRVHPALKDYLGYCLFKSANKMRSMLDQSLMECSLQSIHFGILSILNQGEVCSQIHMGEEMGIDKASMVKLIDKLESLKLVERLGDPKDRRIKLLKITTLGKSTFVKAKKIARLVESELLKNLTQKEQELIKNIIPRLLT